jgi:uncharacterized membrane protein
MIWFKDLAYSIGEIVNSKVFSSEMIFIGSAGIGVALAIQSPPGSLPFI